MMLQRFASLPGWSTASRDLDAARREMERLFGAWTGHGADRTSGVFPATNVTETADSLQVTAEIPGIAPDSLEITLENGTLNIAGERAAESDSEGVSYHRREREWGSFRRSLSIPTRIDGDRVEARYVDGVLTIDLPKAAEVRPRQISVQVGA